MSLIPREEEASSLKEKGNRVNREVRTGSRKNENESGSYASHMQNMKCRKQ
jgi:hypothetical protein